MNSLRRVPFLPGLLSLAVILTSALAVSPIFDSVTQGDVVDAFVERPIGYVAMAPVSNVLDTLTLISAEQHFAILIGAVLLFVAWRFLKRGVGPKRHAIASAVFLAAYVVTYAAMALMPRPMMALRSNNDGILKIDFHSHTSASHDGHQSVEALREWHRKAGFDVAYVTDHASVSEAERGLANNSNPVSGGVTLLQGIEVTWSGEHVTIPNAQRVYKGILTPDLAAVDTAGLRLSGFVPGREPILIWNHPRQFGALPPATGPGTMGIRAIEIVNGAPRDIGRLRTNRRQNITAAQSGGAAITSGSDNHGFGYATPAWTIMMIVGWRGAAPDGLAFEIEKVIRDGGYRATRVIERRVAEPGTSIPLTVASIFTVPYTMLTTLSDDERGWWLAWTWLIWGATYMVRRKRMTRRPA